MPEDARPPKRTGKPPELVSIAECLIPWDRGQPVLFNVPGSPHLHLAVFSTVEKLEVFLDRVGTTFSSVKQIHDTKEFLRSVPTSIVLTKDPWITEEGHTRYKMVLRD